MSGAFNSRRTRRKPSINITSLIDVMFLLLIFFMVSSTFREQLGINVDLPKAGTASPQKVEQHEITVDKKGDYYFGQQRVSAAGLKTSLENLLKKDPKATIVLRAHEDADFGKAVRAIDIAREVGGTHLVIPTRPLKNGQNKDQKPPSPR